jgi:catechol 1,2-dioxygenase
MIIDDPDSVTAAVLKAYGGTSNPRLREVLLALVRHLHDFAREVRLSESELQEAMRIIAALGQHTTPAHNEVALMAGTLGLSALVCLLNNGDGGRAPTQANLLGPFWRADAPQCAAGDSLVRSPTPGPGLLVRLEVVDAERAPVVGAEVDVWHSSPTGLYENEDPGQAEMNLRGRFVSDAAGRVSLRTVKPAGYPIPCEGPVGELIKASGRHNYRPAHLHFMVHKRGYKTLITQIYVADDPHIASDVQFGVTRALIGDFERHDAPAPELGFLAPWYCLAQRLTLERGEARRPRAPIASKATRVRSARPR